MSEAVSTIANLDPSTVLKIAAVALISSLIVAIFQSALRQAVWSLFNFVAAFFASLSRITLSFVHFLSARITEGINGLSEEGQYQDGQPRPWVGWFIVGPIVYCTLMLVFMASDLTVAILIFEAMGLTLGGASPATIPIPLDAAMGVLFVALAVFWGIVFFDLLKLTPFSYIWNGLGNRQRTRLVGVALSCLAITVVAGVTMGVWSQAQLKGGLPEPWQTVLPWFIRGCLVGLLICATALSGKPFGSAITATLVLALLIVRAAGYTFLALLHLILTLLRQVIHIPLALIAFVAFVGDRVWNWVASFAWAKRIRVGLLVSPRLEELGGDADSALTFANARQRAAELAAELAESNKAIMRRFYEEVVPSPNGVLEEFVSPTVVSHDGDAEVVAGLEAFGQALAQIRTALPDLQIKVEDQVAEADRVVSRITVYGTQAASPGTVGLPGRRISLSGLDAVRLEDGRVVERWGVRGSAPLGLSVTEVANGAFAR